MKEPVDLSHEGLWKTIVYEFWPAPPNGIPDPHPVDPHGGICTRPRERHA